jgi:hypothetical protein
MTAVAHPLASSASKPKAVRVWLSVAQHVTIGAMVAVIAMAATPEDEPVLLQPADLAVVVGAYYGVRRPRARR